MAERGIMREVSVTADSLGKMGMPISTDSSECKTGCLDRDNYSSLSAGISFQVATAALAQDAGGSMEEAASKLSRIRRDGQDVALAS